MEIILSRNFSLFFMFLIVSMYACTSDQLGMPDLPENIENSCPPDEIIFATQIYPIIVSNCARSGCHDAISQKDGIILDSYENILKEVDPGQPGESELYENLAGVTDEPEDAMPPSPFDPLSSEERQLIYEWIKSGAKNIICESGECNLESVSFSATVYPILKRQCTGCHQSGFQEGSVRLDNYTEIQKQVNNGKLMGSIRHDPGFVAMPPGNVSMNDCSIQQIQAWINEGALND